MADNQRTVLEVWPVARDDLQKFISDRPAWLIDRLKEAHHKKGTRGWSEVQTVIDILQFLKDTQYEY
jgi:hypothetical protein